MRVIWNIVIGAALAISFVYVVSYVFVSPSTILAVIKK
jgi:hypothetical protein